MIEGTRVLVECRVRGIRGCIGCEGGKECKESGSEAEKEIIDRASKKSNVNRAERMQPVAQ